MPSTAREIPEDVPHVLVGREHVDLIEGLEQDGLASRSHCLEGENAGHLERHLVGIHGVVRSVEQLDLEVDERKTGEDSPNRGFLNAPVNGRNELARNRAADNLIVELVSLSPG